MSANYPLGILNYKPELLALATRMGDQETIMWLLNQRTNPNLALLESAKMGDINMVNYFISIGATLIDQAARVAAENGQLETVVFLLNAGASFEDVLYASGKGDQLRLFYALRERYPEQTSSERAILTFLIGTIDGEHIGTLYLIYQFVAEIDPTPLLSAIDQSTDFGREMAARLQQLHQQYVD